MSLGKMIDLSTGMNIKDEKDRAGKLVSRIEDEYCKVCGRNLTKHVQLECDYMSHMAYLKSSNVGTVKTMKQIEKAFVNSRKVSS